MERIGQGALVALPRPPVRPALAVARRVLSALALISRPGQLVMAIVRGGATVRFDAPEASRLQRDDKIVVLCARS